MATNGVVPGYATNPTGSYAQPNPGGPQPVPGLKVQPPKPAPAPGATLTGYQTFNPEAGCCKCETLSQSGVIWVVGLALLAWPLACVPCCMESCHEPYQRPIYSNNGAPSVKQV